MLSKRTARNLAGNIRRELGRMKFSQSELGRRCGLPPARINEILAGKFDPRLGTIERIAAGLEVPLSSLVTPLEETSRAAG